MFTKKGEEMTDIKRTLLSIALSTVVLISIELTSPPGSIDVFVSFLCGMSVYIAIFFVLEFLFGKEEEKKKEKR